MTTNDGSYPIREPGEQLPPDTTFAEGFGLTFTDEGTAQLQERLDRIDDNERHAALLGRRMIIGSSETGSVVTDAVVYTEKPDIDVKHISSDDDDRLRAELARYGQDRQAAIRRTAFALRNSPRAQMRRRARRAWEANYYRPFS